MKLRHILLRHQFEAEDVLRHLQSGQEFSALARKYSICSSASAGGDLGDLKGKRLDPDFEEAAQSLVTGQISSIVRTRFGYHIIQRY